MARGVSDTTHIGNDTLPPGIDVMRMQQPGTYLRPNPVRNQLQLIINGAEQGKISIAIFDINGRKLLEQQLLKSGGTLNTQLPVSHLQTGIYFVHVTTSQSNTLLRFVKQR